MTFREFTTGTREAVEHMLKTVMPPAIIPTLHVDAAGSGPHILVLAPEWFVDDASRGRMIDALLPTIRGLRAERVAWSFQSTDDDLIVLSIDRERHETWRAPLLTPDTRPLIGAWVLLPPNQQAGLLVTPIQKALR